MSYEPRGKVKTLLDAMGADPRRVWSSDEVAKVLGVASFRSTLMTHTDSACRHGLLHRRLSTAGLEFRLIPFEAAAGQSTATGWKPPQMACTRPGAGSVAPVLGARFVPTLAETVKVAASASAPQIAPVAPALTIELDAPLDEQQQDEPEPLTWSIWDDGDLDLFGLVELENGGHRIQAKDVARLRLMLAWLPA